MTYQLDMYGSCTYHLQDCFLGEFEGEYPEDERHEKDDLGD